MARVIGRGILKGHQAGYGWWATLNFPPDDWTDLLFDPDTGIQPLLRVRPFIDEINNYKMEKFFREKHTTIKRVEELETLLEVGSISQSIAYDTNKVSIGGCSFTIADNNQRYIDNVPGSIVFQKYNEFQRLNYSKTAGDFTIGDTITGGTSGTIGKIITIKETAFGRLEIDVFIIS